MYEYLIGDFLFGLLWLFAFIKLKDMRRPIMWSSIACVVLLTVLFILYLIFSFFGIGLPIYPDYWHPQTLFDLSRITGGYYSIEDILFVFFVGGIASFLYEILFRKKISIRKTRKYHLRALVIGSVFSLAFGMLFDVNIIYLLSIFGFAGAISLWIERKDLIEHSIYGGLSFLMIYFVFFLFLNLAFPNFIYDYYNLQNLSGILIFSIPLEEMLFALSFGLIWAPLYEYEHGVKNVKFK